MKITTPKFLPLDRKDNSPVRASRKAASTLSPEQAKLKKACMNFEAIFISYMLKTMHQEDEKSSLFGDGLGSDIYKEMFDEKLAEKMSESGQMKIGDILYNQNAPLIKSSDNAKGQGKSKAAIIDAPAKAAISQSPQIGPMPPAPSDIKKIEPEKTPPVSPPKEISKNEATTKAGASIMSKFEDLISKAAEKFGLEPSLLKAVIQHESGGNPNVISPDGAKGLMQLVDSTSKMMGVVDPFSPIENIMGGAKYLSQLFDKFGGDLKKVLASYNAGPGAVEKFNGVPPYRETQSYVNKVLATYDMENKRN